MSGHPGGRCWPLALLVLVLLSALRPVAGAAPSFHTVWLLGSELSPTRQADIVFCDFFTQRYQMTGMADGFDDLFYSWSHYSVKTAPGGKRRGDFSGARPVRFIAGDLRQPTCLYGYPFVSAGPGAWPLYAGLVSNIPMVFASAVATSSEIFLLNRDILFSINMQGQSPILVFDQASPPRIQPFVASIHHDELGLMLPVVDLPDKHFVNIGLVGQKLLTATDLDADGLVDAVLVAASDALHPTGPQSVYWLSNIGRSFTSAGGLPDLSLLYRLPAGFRAGKIVVGDFDGDGRASDLAVVSGAGSTAPEQVIFLLTSDLAAPVHLLLADMVVGDLALASVAVDQRQPKIARAPGLAAPGRDSLLVAHGSRVWLVPGPVRPAGGRPSDLGLLEAHGAGLLPDFPTHSDVWWSVATGDFDGDGHLDVALAHGSMGGQVLLLSQVAASPNCLCGPGARCLHGGFFEQPTCQCLDPNVDPGTDFAPCEFCRPGFFNDNGENAAPSCRACHASCASCTGAGPGDCTSCPGGALLQGGTCAGSAGPEVIARLVPPSDGVLYEAIPVEPFPLFDLSVTLAWPAWEHVPDGIHTTMAEGNLRSNIHFDTSPAPEEVHLFSGHSLVGRVSFQEDPLRGWYLAKGQPFGNISCQTLVKYNEKIATIYGGGDLMTCAEANSAGRCSRLQQHFGMGLDFMSLGRVVGEASSPDAVVRVVRGTYFGARLITNSTLVSVHWAAMDNDFGIETMVVLSTLSQPVEFARAAATGRRCQLLWYPFQPIDSFHLSALPGEVLLADLPCGQLVPVLAPAGQRPGFLLVPERPDPGTGAVMLLLRNVATGARHRPDLLPPVPVLTMGDLGHAPGAPVPGPLVAASDPLLMAPGRARVFLWTGSWLHVVDVHFDGAAGGEPGRRSHTVRVDHQPAVPWDSLSFFHGGPIIMLALSVNPEDQHSAVVLINPASMAGTLFQQGSPTNGCGCGMVGHCTPPGAWGGELVSSQSLPPEPGAPSTASNEGTFRPTNLRTADLCQCTEGRGMPAADPRHGLCVACEPESGSGPGPAGSSSGASTCMACPFAGCLVCLELRCDECQPGLVLTESGRCAAWCDAPDAPVLAGRQCQTPDLADGWVPALHIPLHPAWASMEARQVAPLRVMHSSEGHAAPMLAAGQFLHLSRTRPEDGQSEEWLVSAAQLLPDARPSETRALRLADAMATMWGLCTASASASAAAGVGVSGHQTPGPLGLALGMGGSAPGAALRAGPSASHSASHSASTPGLTWDLVPTVLLPALPRALPLPWFEDLKQAPPSGAWGPDWAPTPGPYPPGLTKQVLSHVDGLTPMLLTIEAGPLPDLGVGSPPPSFLCDIGGQPMAILSHIRMVGFINVLSAETIVDLMSLCAVNALPLGYPAEELFFEPATMSSGIFNNSIRLVRVPAGAPPEEWQRVILTIPLLLGALPVSFGKCTWVSAHLPFSGQEALPRRLYIAPSMVISITFEALHLEAASDLAPGLPADRPGILLALNGGSCMWLLDPDDRHITSTSVTYMPDDETIELGLLRNDGQPDSVVLMGFECLLQRVCSTMFQAAGAEPALGRGTAAGSGTRNGYGCPMVVLERDPIEEDAFLQAHDLDGDLLMDYVLHYRASGRVVAYMAQDNTRESFRRVVILPGRVAAATGGSLPPPPDILVADVDQDGHMDVVVVDRSADGREASLTVYGRADQTEAWCPPRAEFDPVAGRCACPGAGRFINPATDECQCVEHAVPAGPGAVDCICPVGMQAALSACVCQPGLLPVADEATGRAISPPRCEACHGSCAACSATRPGLRLTVGGPDGFDDIAYLQTHFTVRTAPEGKRRGDFSGTRPVRFMSGGVRDLSCFHGYPFAPDGYRGAPLFKGQVGAFSTTFSSLVVSDGLGIMLNDDLMLRMVLSGHSQVLVFDQASPPRVDPMLMYLDSGKVHLRPVTPFSNAILSDTFGLMDHRLLTATDLDADGQVDAVLVASMSFVQTSSAQSLFWLSNVGRPQSGFGQLADTSLLYQLPAGFRAGQMVVGDFDGDGRASDVAVVSGAGSTAPEQVILLLTSDLAAPVHLLLADMVVDDLALASVAVDQRQPKIARAPGLAAPGHDSLLVAHGSRVWLVPGPVRPAGGRPSDLGLLEAHGAGLLPDFPTHSDVWWSVATGDFDGDGHLDVALAHGSMGGQVLLLSQVAASPNCLCGPGARCLHGGFFEPPTCQCLDPNVDPGTDFAPCEFCREGYFRPDGGACQECDASCQTCAGPGPGGCTSCPTRHTLQQGACVQSPGAEVQATLVPPSGGVFYEALRGGAFATPSHMLTAALPFWLPSEGEIRESMAEGVLRTVMEFSAVPTLEGVSFFESNWHRGSVTFREDRLRGGYHVVEEPFAVPTRHPVAKYDQKIPISLDSSEVSLCGRDNAAGQCQTVWKNFDQEPHHLTLGRVAGQASRPGADRPSLHPAHLGGRRRTNDTLVSVQWAAMDNDFGIETMVVLSALPQPVEFARAATTDRRCQLLWYPFQAFDVASLPALPGEVLLADLPCGQLVPVLAPAGQRPGAGGGASEGHMPPEARGSADPAGDTVPPGPA
ncbi:hypothetical protein H696_06116 [Fonticula alba]|uniref:Cytochrome c domain-containing protein n=1 Tax=Fonticula alba TaxID=691883 RepID=A0A058YZM0_FONAL|nr:hypothetical protein H696_06116 [Fonticula alba]KCV67424.1 hypothetical protein H696_06116 [Fonticula alba]|eukprot:XP_009498151.1 hypothetical protein H696_06116 [Fonticula alba]